MFRTALAVLVVASIGAIAMPGSAHAWWRGGFHGGGFHGGGFVFGFAPPLFYAPPPVYYAPPAYYPPPTYYAPPPPTYYAPQASNGPAQSCNAGAYVCPLDHPTPVGAACACPTYNGRVGGRAG